MKNSFKFGFLGLALTVALASCGGNETKTEEAASDVATEIENVADSIADSLNNVADSVTAEADSIAEKLENVQ